MKTSAQQFEMLVTYMEQHGDLTKPTTNAKGRISRIKDWEDLTALLNSDGSGDTKSTEKWKKVWSDFKNNTKKKAARLHRAATGTGGGPAVFAKLTDLEQRVLNIIGDVVATGLPIDELGPEQNVHNVHEDSTETEAVTVTSQSLLEQWNRPGPSNQVHVPPPTTHQTPPPHIPVEEIVIEYDEDSNQASQVQPGPGVQPALFGQTPISSPQRRNIVVSPRRNIMVSPRRRTTGATRRRYVSPGRRVISPRRRPAARAEEAAQQFLQSDVEWRHFRVEQQRQEIELRREGNRVRQMEVETERGWQSIASRALDLLEKLVAKYCGDSI